MTQKELLYVEDAISHENSIITICDETSCYLEDETLITFMKNEMKKNCAIKELLMYLFVDKA